MGDRTSKWSSLFRLYFRIPHIPSPNITNTHEITNLQSLTQTPKNEFFPNSTQEVLSSIEPNTTIYPDIQELMESPLLELIKNNTDEIEVSLKGLHPSIPEISVASNDKTMMIMVTVAIVVIVLCIFGYCYGVKKAKMKPRHNITVNPQITVNPSFTADPANDLVDN